MNFWNVEFSWVWWALKPCWLFSTRKLVIYLIFSPLLPSCRSQQGLCDMPAIPVVPSSCQPLKLGGHEYTSSSRAQLRCESSTPCSFGLSTTSHQYFSLRTNQPPATSQQFFYLRTNQHQPPATSQTNKLYEYYHSDVVYSVLAWQAKKVFSEICESARLVTCLTNCPGTRNCVVDDRGHRWSPFCIGCHVI
jgi:hypothetical protein